jgi:hypothetical protein
MVIFRVLCPPIILSDQTGEGTRRLGFALTLWNVTPCKVFEDLESLNWPSRTGSSTLSTLPEPARIRDDLMGA